jgi:hypothetical protein
MGGVVTVVGQLEEAVIVFCFVIFFVFVLR